VTTHFLSSRLAFVPVLREPQQERSHATRARLVKSAASCLVKLGYANASTAAMAKRAGVSQGALFKHFPTKADLLAACLERILADCVDAFREELAATPRLPLPERIPPAIAALWRIFRAPGMRAVFEVYVVARTDAALARQLEPILTRHREAILAEGRRLFPELPVRPDFDAAIDAVVYAMQGVALGVFAPDDPGGAADAGHIVFFERLARHELAHALASSGSTSRSST
jgi:AcrR family transcriptional regulator